MTNLDQDDSERPSSSELRRHIAYLEEALTAISSGGVDAVVIGEPEQEQIYTLTSADRPYRVIVESMGEGAVTVSECGVILFANPSSPRFLGVEPRQHGRARHARLRRARTSARPWLALLGPAPPRPARGELTIAGADGARCRSWWRPPTSTSRACWCAAWCSPT